MSHVQARRECILEASARLFASKGVAATSMREIAESVGVRPGALYHYFPSKDAIVNELITGYLEQLQAEYESMAGAELDPRSRLRAIVDVSLRTAQDSPYATQIFQNELANLRELAEYRRAKLLSDRVQQVWIDAIEEGRSQGVFRTDIPTKVFHRFIRDAVWLSIKWHRSDDPYSIDDLADDCLAVFLDGFAVSPPVPPRPAAGEGTIRPV
ncbi:TetR/AcrR family transcriptional regulator [Rhodococcus triatomae]|uniref:DNA-binding transcriptional regulator, AcrR family n=1 Tax=Rhodococcus triatomae TaxID=300028 RepID=A0A1G8BB15_9NOCA|nr:TetR/AcrR family transcriptional regulator [Rhodococcus triatomae]QNG17477.1 TetR/AcrR family transcriptional regulator [Rhodococcus triatomae]QNG22855.1 TetR/AcrR family transcriptional regulator [Rhodococcus triatomae]SDH30405.1 DNA-binding transcriptional regulator, AcrR family [Rhodococcus triatomae]